MSNAAAFQAPLHVLDTEKQTFGCRYSKSRLLLEEPTAPSLRLRAQRQHLLGSAKIVAKTISETSG